MSAHSKSMILEAIFHEFSGGGEIRSKEAVFGHSPEIAGNFEAGIRWSYSTADFVKFLAVTGRGKIQS